MTDRVAGFYVALREDIREDDVEPLMNAMLQMRGVVEVKTIVPEPFDWMQRVQVRNELADKIMNVLREE